MQTKLHAIWRYQRSPLKLLSMLDSSAMKFGARSVVKLFPNLELLLEFRNCGTDWFRAAYRDNGISARGPGETRRKLAVKDGNRQCKRHNRFEILAEELVAHCDRTCLK